MAARHAARASHGAISLTPRPRSAPDECPHPVPHPLPHQARRGKHGSTFKNADISPFACIVPTYPDLPLGVRMERCSTAMRTNPVTSSSSERNCRCSPMDFSWPYMSGQNHTRWSRQRRIRLRHQRHSCGRVSRLRKWLADLAQAPARCADFHASLPAVAWLRTHMTRFALSSGRAGRHPLFIHA